jgi:predicted nucleotidyltransferase
MKIEPKTLPAHLTDNERQAAMEFVERMRRRFDGQLVSAVLFGSRARGEARLDSDMDVVVVMAHADPKTRREVRDLAVEIWLKYGIYLSTRVWSEAHWHDLEKLRTLLYQNIQRDGINLLETDPATG